MDYRNKVLNVISELSVLPADEIDIEDNFSEIGIDSLKMVELVIKLEDVLNIKFDDGELNPSNLTAVKNILALTDKYVFAGV